jgi:CRP-like cAMP-binding protein
MRLLFGALVISATGSWAYNVALLAFIYARTHSLGWVGAAGLARMVPQLILSAYGGVLAERMRQVRLMVGSDLLCAVLQAGLGLVAAAGGSPVLALILTALTAAAGVVYQPATAATIPHLVGEDELVAANALNSTIDQLVVIAGPGVGAVLLLAGSSAAVFFVNAISFVISAVLVSRISTPGKAVDVTDAGEAGPLRQMTVGAKAIAALPAARTLVAFCVLVSFVYGTDTVLFVGVSAHKLGTGAQGWGYLLAGLGVGGILGAPTIDRIAGSPRLGTIILLGALGYCLPTALLIVVHSPVLAFLIQVFRGGSTLIVDVLAFTALQRAVAPDQLARVFGVFFAFIIGAIALASVLTPVVTGVLGLDGGLLVMAIGPSLLALAGYPELLRIDRQTQAQARALEPRIALLEGLGIFANASRPILERLARAATEVGFAAEGLIVREGDEADALYVLTEGEVQVSARGETADDERPIRVMTAPSYFGEIGVLERIPRTATVRARGDTRLLRISDEDLREALTASPASNSLMENARFRLSVTHPARAASFGEESGLPDGMRGLNGPIEEP